MTKEAGLQLERHFEKTEHQLQHPRISDVMLNTNAKWVLAQLELEREAARDEQGYPERVLDWWAAPIRVAKKKRKGKKQVATAGQGVSVERLPDDVAALGLGADEEIDEEMEEEEEEEEEEGGVLLEDDFEGFKSPVMMSPAGSVVGDGEKEKEEEEEEEEQD